MSSPVRDFDTFGDVRRPESAPVQSAPGHGGVGCACCAGLSMPFDRRKLLRGAGAAVALLTLAPRLTLAAEGNYEAMILACIDPRFQEPVHPTPQSRADRQVQPVRHRRRRDGVVAPKFADWHKAFWDNLRHVELHHIKKSSRSTTAIAARPLATAACATPDKETQTHRAAMAEFRKEAQAPAEAGGRNRADGARRLDGHVHLGRGSGREATMADGTVAGRLPRRSCRQPVASGAAPGGAGAA
jgi:hypothetical protein